MTPSGSSFENVADTDNPFDALQSQPHDRKRLNTAHVEKNADSALARNLLASLLNRIDAWGVTFIICSEQALVALTYTPQSKRARLSRRSNCIQPPVFAQHADSVVSSGRRTNLGEVLEEFRVAYNMQRTQEALELK